MKILIFLGHPAHYHLFKHVIRKLKERKVFVNIVVVKKDILEDLVRKENWEYINLVPEGRQGAGPFWFLLKIFGMIRTEWRLLKFLRKNKSDFLVGTEFTLAHVGKILGIPVFLINEDDAAISKTHYFFYPFSTKMIMPSSCDASPWNDKKISYEGYHELAYLHPNYFSPNKDNIKVFNPEGQRYFIVRLVSLTASHDMGKKGISNSMARRLIKQLEQHGKVFITSERPLLPEFEQYRLAINVHHIFDALYYADMVIGDSQTMIAEAAVLGTPAVRFNDFVGRLGYLEELEHKYELTFGFKTYEEDKFIKKIGELLKIDGIKEIWQKKRKKMLNEKIDAAEFIASYFCEHLEGNTQSE